MKVEEKRTRMNGLLLSSDVQTQIFMIHKRQAGMFLSLVQAEDFIATFRA